MSFVLSKWYFDLLDEQNRGIIGYQAMLTWGKLTLGYSGSINFSDPSNITDENQFTTQLFQQTEAQTKIEFKTDALKGTWLAIDAPYSHNLLAVDSGKIDWSCVQPKSNVTLETKVGQLTGYGYVEKIELTLPPWKIPIKELIWGRYHSAQHTLVWIKWSGPVPQTIIFFNGKRIEQGSVSESELVFENYVLQIFNTRAIRQSTVGESVFKYFGAIMKLFPSSIMTLHEAKWCAAGTLTFKGAPVDSGTIIHELVRWP